MVTLRQYQEEGVEWLMPRKRALLADDMGVGKTIQALFAAARLGLKTILVVCPCSVKTSWYHKVEEYGLNYERKILHSKDLKIIQGINIINYDLVRRLEIAKILIKNEYDCLILDEAHYLKNHEAKQTRRVLGKGGLVDSSRYAWALTGTPITNRPKELYSILLSMYPKALAGYETFFRFAERYCDSVKKKFGWDYNGASNIEELAQKIRPFFLRRLKSEVVTELPPVIYNRILLNPSIREQVLLEKELQAYLSHKNIDEDLEKARQQLGESKIADSIKIIKDLLETKEKVVVFAYHRHICRLLVEGLTDYKPVLYYGGISDKEKDKAIHDFTKADSRVFVGNINACGTGIDGLQHSCDTCVFVELVWTPALIEQAVSRLNRIGQRGAVNTFFIMYEGSVDTQIYDKLSSKEEVINQLLSENRETITKSMRDIDREEVKQVKGEEEIMNKTELRITIDWDAKKVLGVENISITTIEPTKTDVAAGAAEITTPSDEVKVVRKRKGTARFEEVKADEVKAGEESKEETFEQPTLTGLGEEVFNFKAELEKLNKALLACEDKKKTVALLDPVFNHCQAKTGHRQVINVTDVVLQKELVAMIKKNFGDAGLVI